MGDFEFAKRCLAEGEPWHTIPIHLEYLHDELWKEEPTEYWLMRMMAEMGELASALAGDHEEHPWELEAAQVASIAMNMLRHHGGQP